jgi:diaminopimelate epimerase
MKDFKPESMIAKDEKFAIIGKEIENLTEIFPNRTNVEFVVQTGENAFDCFIWERGSGATLACGTGACAVARAAVHNKLADETKPLFVMMAGSYQGGEIIPMKVKLQNTCTLFTNAVSLVGKVSL